MSFAPYQDLDPSAERSLSPPPPRNRTTSPRLASPRGSYEGIRNGSGNIDGVLSPPRITSPAPRDVEAGFGGGFGGRREEMDPFETSLGVRMDYEACLAYLLLPPAAGVVLLVFEHKSDYVRFHAWQSSLLFAFIFVGVSDRQNASYCTHLLMMLTGRSHHICMDKGCLVDVVCLRPSAHRVADIQGLQGR